MSKSSNLVKGDDRVEEMKEDEKDGQLVDQLMVSKYKVIYKVLFCLSVYADQKQILCLSSKSPQEGCYLYTWSPSILESNQIVFWCTLLVQYNVSY